ncbi:MAG: FprA family A-type flavoprotein [Clostridia bacterium]|nr:FprA family A-type flavoprotein [Clostridia bacterium]
MHCTKKIKDDLVWVGGNDRRLELFEGVYEVPEGISYNAYLLKDEKNVLFDTVDKAVSEVFFENLRHELKDGGLDYIIVQHMEPDHSATLAGAAEMYPSAKIVCSVRCAEFIKQFFDFELDSRLITVGEGDTLETGKHLLRFITAPMVHWPEVIVTYDEREKILFSADAFGIFGAQQGGIFADTVDFESECMDEARRYFANIVGKYGPQTAALLKKTAALEIRLICPLHGYVFRRDFDSLISKYMSWASYIPEQKGVLICYASVYGNTQNAAEAVAAQLAEMGVQTRIMDVSKSPASQIIAMSFKYSHLVFASVTYNSGAFVTMEAVLHDMAAHNLQNRTIAFIQNGTWAPGAEKSMKKILEGLKNCSFIEPSLTVKSALHDTDFAKVRDFAGAIYKTL